MAGLFVTGTDTGVGKTVAACALLHALAAAGHRTAAMKPVAAGCHTAAEGLRNDDALALRAAATEPASYAAVNPVALEPACAPHLAAAEAGVAIDIASLARGARALEATADTVVVEGAGGWRVPVSPAETLADLARALGYPVVLVVAIRLGCLNHALLSAEAIRADGLALAGWIANCPDADTPRAAAQIDALQARLGAPLLGTLEWDPAAGGEGHARQLRCERLFSRSEVL